VTSLGKLLRFLERLEAHHFHYTLGHFRESINVLVTVPGERWEVEFLEDGTVEVEVFGSSGFGVEGEDAVERLFANAK
jgi:L-fucose isomerase-like protein